MGVPVKYLQRELSDAPRQQPRAGERERTAEERILELERAASDTPAFAGTRHGDVGVREQEALRCHGDRTEGFAAHAFGSREGSRQRKRCLVRYLRPADRGSRGGGVTHEADVGVLDGRDGSPRRVEKSDREQCPAIELAARHAVCVGVPREFVPAYLRHDGNGRGKPCALRACHGSKYRDFLDIVCVRDSKPMDRRSERQAQNEALFRDVNERIEELVDEALEQHTEGTTVWDFVCECQDRSCAERIPLTRTEYEAIRADGRRFVVAPSPVHVDTSIENVVDMSTRYWVVEKIGEPGAFAEEHDPRDRGAEEM